MPVSVELMIILSIDDPESLGHANTENIFHVEETCYSLRGKDVIGHIQRGLAHYRDLLTQQKAKGGNQFVETVVNDSLDTWLIRYELREDGTVVKTYTLIGNEADKFEVTMDATGNLHLPKLPEGQSFSIECFGDSTGDERLTAALAGEVALQVLAANPVEKT